MRTLFLSITSLLMSGFLTTAMATKYAMPQDSEVKSDNGKYVLKITAKTGKHGVYEGDKLLWSFEREVWHNGYFLSNDGKHVLWVAWKHMKAEHTDKKEAVVAYAAEGKVMSKTFGQVSEPRPRGAREVGPIGDFWRLWRGKMEQEGNKVTIAVAGKEPLVIDLANPKGGD